MTRKKELDRLTCKSPVTVTRIEPVMMGPYAFDKATGKLTIGMSGRGGPYQIVLANPRPMLAALAKLLDGEQTTADREGWAQ